MANSITRLLTISAVLALGGGVLVSAGPGAASAQPMCDGKAATIVVTHDNQTVEGTARQDVILVDGDYIGLVVRGNGGDDRICGGPHNERLEGGPGDDRIFAGAGTDRLLGGKGGDLLAGQEWRHSHDQDYDPKQYYRPGPGRDFVRGYAGRRNRDIVDYSHSDRAVRVDLADPKRGTDSLRRVHTVIGSRFDDRMSAAGRGRDLYGMGGDDELISGHGGSTLVGETYRTMPGVDGLVGPPGAPGDDRLLGGSGSDHAVPGAGHNVVRSRGGSDWVEVEKARGDVLVDGTGGRDLLNLTSARSLRLDLRDPEQGSYSVIRGFNAYNLIAPSGRVDGTSGGESLSDSGDTRLELYGHGGNDSLHGRIAVGGAGSDDITQSQVGRGGSGDDRLLWVVTASGGPGADEIGAVEGDGGAGDDEIYVGWNVEEGGDLAPQFLGGAGDDRFEHLVATELEGIELDGGTGSDIVDLTDDGYLGATVDLAAGTEEITFPDRDDPDGPPVTFTAALIAIEDVVGTFEDDELLGSSADNRLIGHAGDDTIDGRGGTDTCAGETVSNCER